MRLLWHDFLATVALLTQVPIGGPAPTMPRALRMMGLVGALIGAAAGAVLLAAHAIGLPPLAAAFLSLGAMALLTGALHEDGLADFADGFGGGRDREQILHIMADSRIGAFGALTLVVATGLRAAMLAAIVATASWHSVVLVLAVAASLARTAPVAMLRRLPAAKQTGLGASVGRPDLGTVAAAAAVPVALAVGLIATAGNPPSVGVALVVGLLAAVYVESLARHRLGGHTGDVAGAMIVLTETGVLLGLGVGTATLGP